MCYTTTMKISRLIFLIAAIVVGVWLLGIAFKLAAWLINGLLYVAAVVVIIGLVSAYFDSRRTPTKKP